MAKTRHAKYKRDGHRAVSLSTPEKYRLLIVYPGQDRTRHFTTSDLARARSTARRNAASGAHVTLQHHEGWGRYTTTNTYAPEPR
ncbi:hypothetical protein ACIOEZ_34015 [Streptomyces sp. NPDC087866]|uniref:hypothetical protein n=1 Tax=Streptomyces sp. NPDC087866 TaxID=3365815 RepID=UPI0038020FF5